MLFVEDHPDVLAMYERTFRHHEIILVDTGELALKAIRQQRDFDLVVCDLLLPDIDGVEVYRRVRQMEPELAATIRVRDRQPTLDSDSRLRSRWSTCRSSRSRSGCG